MTYRNILFSRTNPLSSSTRKQKKNRKRAERRPLRCEALEARRVLTAYIVTTVDDTVGVDGEVSLREALQAANTNAVAGDAAAGEVGATGVDSITFAAALSDQIITLTNGQLEIFDDVTIDASAATNLTIDADGLSRVLSVTDGQFSTVTGLTLTGGNAVTGGGIFVGSTARIFSLNDVTIEGNVATGDGAEEGGGGIFNDGRFVSAFNTVITNNHATGVLGSGGGVLNRDGFFQARTGTSINNNTANRAGGGIEATAGSSTTLTDANLDNNTAGPAGSAAPGNGGGLHITGDGDATIIGGTVNNNVAASEGGGLWNGSGVMTVNGTTISGNRAAGSAADQGGGGVFNAGGTVEITDATISDNLASGAGVIALEGAQEVPPVTTAAAGTATFQYNAVSGTFDLDLFVTGLELTDTTGAPELTAAHIHVGAVGAEGPVIVNLLGSESFVEADGGLRLTLNDVTLPAGNVADLASGNLYFNVHSSANAGGEIRGQLVLPATMGSGGGVLNDGGLVTVTDTLISGNVASRAGGGIEATAGSTTSLSGVNLDGNVAGPFGFATPGNGGGLHITGDGDATITGGTVNDNFAGSEGGGLWNGIGLMTVDGTTISGNSAAGAAADQGGGGVFNAGGTVDLTGATISDNLASGAGTIALEGAQEVPAVTTSAGGTADFQFNAATGTFDLDLFVTGLELTDTTAAPELTAAHIHVGAVGAEGPVILNLLDGNSFVEADGGLRLTLNDVALPAENVADLASGNLYFNVHSSANAGGEIRGQLVLPTTSGSGGGVLNDGGTLTVTNSAITGNVANRAGGGIEVTAGSSTTLIDVSLDNNVAGAEGFATPGNGGGLHISGFATVDINGGSASGNLAGNEGGGLWNSNVGILSVDGTTIENNEAVLGGGIFTQGGGGEAVRLTLTNVAPDGGATDSGLFLTPIFNAFHDGAFDLFNVGEAASAGIERLAEDGNNAALTTAFETAQSDGVAASLAAGGPIAPGASLSSVFVLNPTDNRYYSYASMVIPSNDAFIGNEDAQMFELFDADGNLLPIDFTVPGSAVWDAGTEVNDEVDAAFFDQMSPDTGTIEGGTVASHPGFIDSVGNPGGTPLILGGTQSVGPLRTFGTTNADFTTAGYDLLQVSIVAAGSGTTLSNVIVNSNTATGAASDQGGGGIFQSDGALTITGSEITDNVANGAAGSGGGILNSGGTVNVSGT
ncbi:MAG: CHRD domain-containing protein, partial [Pirellulaceae bacterium]